MKYRASLFSAARVLAALVALHTLGCTLSSDGDSQPSDGLADFDIDGDGMIDDLDGDLDGDGLSNRKELEIGTDPNLADSDGDKYDDLYEFTTNPRVDPSRPFHPLIADIPQIRVEIVKRPAFHLTTTKGESTSESITLTEGESINREESTSYGVSRSFGNEINFAWSATFSQAIDAKVTSFGGSWGMSSGFTAGYVHTTDETYTFDSTTTESFSTNLETSRETARQTSREITGAHIVGAIRLYNAGNVAVNVENLNAAYAHLSSNGKITEARSLEYEGAYAGGTLNFTLAPGEQSSPISFYLDIDGADAAFAMAEDMARAGSIQLMADSMLLSNETAGNFTDVYTNVKSRSARIMIDPGPTFRVGGHNAILDKHVVATPKFDPTAVAGSDDPYVDTTLADMLKLVGKEFTVEEREIDGELRFGITSVDGIAEDLETDSFWLVALETKRHAVNGTIYFTPLGSYRPDEIAVLPGETVQLIYSADKDKDGVPARIELAARSSDDNEDTDGDGVPDALEIFGWCKIAGAPTLGQLDADGRPTGECEQAGQQVIFTKPDRSDTDGDLLNDLEDELPLERPRFATAGLDDVSVIHNRGAGEPALPAAGEEPTPPAFVLNFNASHLDAAPPEGIEGVYRDGTVTTTEPGLESIIREEFVQWDLQTTQRAEAAYVTGPQGGARISLQRDETNDLRFLSEFEGVEIDIGLNQTWTIELLSEAAATECGYTGTYKNDCDYEVYKVVLDSAPGFPRTYYAAALNGDGGWESNQYQGDTNRYLRTLSADHDGWNVSPRFRGATDGRIEAAFFVMCETEQQLSDLHAQAFEVPVADLTSWTGTSGSSLLDGVSGCKWSSFLATAVHPTDGTYDWDWSGNNSQNVVFVNKRRHTYHTRLYTVGRALDGFYTHSRITRTFKSVDPPNMKITGTLSRIDDIGAKRWCAGSSSWCADETNVRFRVKVKAEAGDTTADFAEIVWHGTAAQNPSSRTVTGNITPSGQMDPDDLMVRVFDNDNDHWIDAYFQECDITPTLSPRTWLRTFEEVGANGTFKGSTTLAFYTEGENRDCVTDWRFWMTIRFVVSWESTE